MAALHAAVAENEERVRQEIIREARVPEIVIDYTNGSSPESLGGHSRERLRRVPPPVEEESSQVVSEGMPSTSQV